MMVEIECRCCECRWVLINPLDGKLSCGHPDLNVEPRWVTEEDRAEAYLPVEPEDFCSKGEWCG